MMEGRGGDEPVGKNKIRGNTANQGGGAQMKMGVRVAEQGV
jgi:hypothetical protein